MREDGHLPAIKRELSVVSEDDLYSATPIPRARGQNKDVAIKEGSVGHLEASVSGKRRRILARGDWVGITVQQLPRATFNIPKHDEAVGRRRKLTDDHRARYNTKREILSPPFVRKKRPNNFDTGRQRNESHGRGDVRISVGCKVVPAGFSSSSAPSRSLEHPHLTGYSRKPSSDVMLLDNEEALAGQYTGVHVGSDGQFSILQSSSSAEIQEPSSGDQAGYRSSRHQHSPNISDRYGGHHISSSQSGAASNDEPPQPIFSSSSASIQHPIPLGSKLSLLLRSSSSDIADSTIARVGKAKPLVPSSQVLDNEIWETWISPFLDEKQNATRVDVYSSERQLSISPGVSNALISKNGGGRVPSRHSDATAHSDTMDSMEVQQVVSQTNSSQEASMNKPTKADQVSRQEPIHEVLNFTARPIKKVSNDLPPISVPERRPRPGLAPKKPSKAPDPDEIWKKFVFGGYSDELVSKGDDLPLSPALDAGDRTVLKSSTIANISAEDLPSTANFKFSAADLPKIVRKAVEAIPGLGNNSRRPDTKYWKSLIGAVIHSLSSTQDDTTSVHISQRPLLSSSSNVALSAAAAISSQSGNSEAADSTPSRLPPRILSSKSKPFLGLTANLEDPIAENDTLYIGRGVLEKDGGECAERKMERDVYSLVSSDEMDSIEDD